MSDLTRHWPLLLAGHPQIRQRLEKAYDGPGRSYHDLRHLAEVLANVELLLEVEPGAGADRDTVLLAGWFHDAVHDATDDDEALSARLAESELTRAGLPRALVAEVARLVRLTRTHTPADDDPAGHILCDADLAILAADPTRYAAYVEGVRREYAAVPDDDFRRGRASLLRALSDKPSLFHTGYARRCWEPAARANLARELAGLESAPG